MHTPDSSLDQRSSPRIPASSLVWIQCRRVDAAEGSQLANGLLNVSEGGVQFISREPLAVGDLVTITLAGARMRGSIRRSGDVRWVAELGGGACCVGVQFDQLLVPDDVEALLPAAEQAAPADRFIFD
jgi:hypothetical protein